MLSKKDKSDITRSICESETFAKSPVQSSLLEYLVEATLRGEKLKELTIGIDFFGEEPEALRSGTRVRGAIYNLRKKLDNYYEGEGLHNTWRLSIAKGQYAVDFEKNTHRHPDNAQVIIRKVLPWSVAMVCVLFLIYGWLPKSKPAIWRSFMDSTKPSTVYLGDYFGMMGPTITGRQGWTRDFDINNIYEYYDFRKEKPVSLEATEPSNIYYLTPFAVYSVNSMAQFALHYDWKYDIRFSSKAEYAQIMKENTIYFGAIKNENKFIDIFNANNPYFKIDSTKLLFSNHAGLADTVFSLDRINEQTDPTIVARLQGNNGTEQFYFFSNHDMGITAVASYFTRPDSIKAFSERYLRKGEYFVAIARVEGKNRTGFNLNFDFVVDLDY